MTAPSADISPAALIASFTRRLPIYKGGGVLAHRFPLRQLANLGPKIVWAPLATGDKIIVDRTDLVGRMIYYMGDFSPEISYACTKLLRAGDVALDIGANLGEVAFHMAAQVGEQGAVIAIEPNPRMGDWIAQGIQRRFEHNKKHDNLQLQRCALGGEAGEAVLSIPTGNAGAASLARGGNFENADHVTVPVRTLDELLSQTNNNGEPAQVRVIKMDVEGFEEAVLSGATQTLATQPPHAIIFENNTPKADEAAFTPINEAPVFSTLIEAGYRFWKFERHFGPPTFTAVTDTNTPAHDAGHDVLALHPNGDIAEMLTMLGA